MKSQSLCLAAVWSACAMTSSLAAPTGPETVDYTGRLTMAGKPFTGNGNFKFALLLKDGTRLWTNGDDEAPIEQGVPSGSVALPVQEGSFHVRLGDPGLGMKQLPKPTGAPQQPASLEVWFDDGVHGWSFTGQFELSHSTIPSISSTPSTSLPPYTKPSADLNEVLAEVRALRLEVAELKRDLGVKSRPGASAISAPVAAPASGPTKPTFVTLPEAKRHALGNPDAPLVLVEFTDYQCGYCKRFFEQSFPRLQKEYIDTGKLRFVSRNMPVATHPRAEPAALALLSAAERSEDDYWQMRAWLFANQRDLGDEAFGRYAVEAKLDRAQLMASVASKKHGKELQEDTTAARTLGITGTPSFVLGTSDGQFIRGERVTGALSFVALERKLQAALAQASAPATAQAAKP